MNIIEKVVNNDLCIGCGLCASICPAKNLKITFNKHGKYEPASNDNCIEKCDLCLKVCPFGTEEYSKNEDEISREFFDIQSQHKYTGFYTNTYAGHVNSDKQRLSSTSGGILKFLLSKLLKDKIIDYVIHVVPWSDPEKLYKYVITSDYQEFENSTAKSAYYPAELSEILEFVNNNEGKYAITALPCFIKGIRLAQLNNKNLKSRIKFVFGLTCGQLKSKYFTKYISCLMGLNYNDKITKMSYREKSEDQPSTNYYFKIEEPKPAKLHWKQGIDYIWNNRWFTLNSCNYCDDIFAELADISFMDAWLAQYSKDWKGTSIVISRSGFLDDLIESAKKDNLLAISYLSPELVVKSQQEVINTKRTELAWRLYEAKKANKITPLKRVKIAKPNLLNRKYTVMKLKDIIRLKSFEYYPDILFKKDQKLIMAFLNKIIWLLNFLPKIKHKLKFW